MNSEGSTPIKAKVMPMRATMPFFLLSVSFFASAAWSQTLDDVVLPSKTEVFIQLQRSINSKTASPGDKFSALVEVPVTHRDKILIPVGSFVIGHIVERAGAGRIKGKAELLLAFDTVILPDGTTRKMRAAVQAAEGFRTDSADEEGRIEASGSQAAEVLGAAAETAVTGAITGATIGLFRGQTLRGAGIGAAIGAAGGGLIGLLQRGEEVELPRGSSLTIQLQDPARFVKPTPPPVGERFEP